MELDRLELFLVERSADFVGGFDLNEALEELERLVLEAYLKATGGNVLRTARLLNLRRTTLVERLKKHDLKGQMKCRN